MPVFENNSFLPLLIEFWIYDKNKTKTKRSISLMGRILEPNTKININSVNNNFYVSSLFEKSDITNIKIWNDNKLPNEMICYISEPEQITLKSELFNCIYENINNISYYSIYCLLNTNIYTKLDSDSDDDFY